LVLEKDSWLNLDLILSADKDFSDYQFLEQTIIPYPVFLLSLKENVPGIIHSFWFKELSSNTLIDVHLVYCIENNKQEFIFYFNDKLMRNEGTNNESRINSALNHASVSAKDNRNFLNKIMSNTPNTILTNLKLKNTIELKNITPTSVNKDNLENKLINYIYSNFIVDKFRLEIYMKKISKFYQQLYKTKNDDPFLRTLINDVNTYFEKNSLLNEKQEIKKVKNKSKDLMGILERNAFSNRQMLIFGRHGVGKTYGIRKFVEKYGYKLVIIKANNSVDDIYLKGHLMRDYDGNFKWKYGKLSLAYKMAEKEKVIVFIDEFLRLPETTFNNLITAMDPYENFYLFDTEKPIKNLSLGDDSLETEELKIPTENLWFICATNIGSEYNVEELEPALKDRFIPYHLNMTDQEKYDLIKSIVKEKGFHSEVENVLSFFKKMQRLYQSKTIPNEINIRHISDVIMLAEDPEDIKYCIFDKILVWVNNDLKGTPIKEQYEGVKKIISEVWNDFS